MGQNTENVRTTAENTTRFPDFQAEYEGSIPFTRSNVLKSLSPQPQSAANDAAQSDRRTLDPAGREFAL
jgi:hypothetical protein